MPSRHLTHHPRRQQVTTDKRTFRKAMHPVQWGRRGRSARCAPQVLASPTTHPILPPPAHQPTAVWWRSTAQGTAEWQNLPGRKRSFRDAYGAGSRLHGSRDSACQRIALGALCYRRLSQHDKPTPHRCSQRSSGAVGDLIAKDDAFFSFQERWLARQRPARRRQCSHCGPGWSHTGPFPG